MIERLEALDRALVAKGWPALSAWWLAAFRRFVRRTAKQFVARVGRRGGKSSSLCRFAVAFAISYDVSQIPPGDVGVVAFVSVSRDEASQRLRTIRAILDALGISHRPIDGGIELVDRPIAFKVYAASIAGVSGFTSILVIADEVAKWKDADTGSNPAAEVLASIRPTMATQPDARIFLSSSPLGMADAHAEAFAEGENDFQIVAHAPTWIANPTISEERTHELERDARRWSREYAAVPQAGTLSAFDVDAVDRAFARMASGEESTPIVIVDPSSGRKDAWTWALARWVGDAGARRVLRVSNISSVEGRFFEMTALPQIVGRVAATAKGAGAREVHADQRESYALSSAFESQDLSYLVHDWTASSKPLAVERVRRWFADGTIAIEPHDKMRRELLAFEERITPSGSFTFGARGSGHDDYVALLITCALADLAGQLDGSPLTDDPDPEGKALDMLDAALAEFPRGRLEKAIGDWADDEDDDWNEYAVRGANAHLSEGRKWP